LSHKYRDLIVWQKAKALTVDLYRATEQFPRVEVYGLTSQLRRAAISVVSNIADGQGRLTKGEFAHFLGQARGSLLELETQLEVALELGFIPKDDFRQAFPTCVGPERLINSLRVSRA